MHVHTLRFTTQNDLMRSFDHLARSSFVEDCLVEPESLRIRFLAPPNPGNGLVERIYLDGGLTWCSRHRLGSGR